MVATCAIVRDGETLGERRSRAVRVLADIDELLREVRAEPGDVDKLVVGTGPGSFTGVRMGLAAARALAFALDVPAAGVSTLDALTAGTPGAVPVIDAGRREVFTIVDGQPVCRKPEDLAFEARTTCVGDGAVRYRALLEAAGASIPPDDSDRHVPWARLHVALARDFGPAERIEPIYLRLPDAERALAP